ncbi:MAG: hypothetical protein C7B46_19915 [Sulfobacillus benefaciens]|uniref:Replication initiator protein A n=1 Tax=Sulfobacillus benefaciens TaxID=453960 RepID=A0A2T2WW84_9FIRM|nr:MAG: hypothetical protein C7B46_19915 [Sulfobacillus benefaciens]
MSSYPFPPAYHDPAYCLAPGLFSAVPHGQRHQPFRLVYAFGKTEHLEFLGHQRLGADDLKTLLALVTLASSPDYAGTYQIDPDTAHPIGQRLRGGLELQEDAVRKPILAVHTSFYRLGKLVGFSHHGTRQIQLIQDSLERLALVTVIVQSRSRNKTRRTISHIIGWCDSTIEDSESSGTLWVALDTRITEAVLGMKRYSLLFLRDVQILGSDVAVLLYQRLCGWIDPGIQRSIALDTLVQYVYPHDVHSTTHPNHTEKKLRWYRRHSVLTALEKFRSIHWDVTIDRMDRAPQHWMVTIRRPSPSVLALDQNSVLTLDP